jgi:NodT family efflux transporter outer membrane factor (OMF) lipoprotein
LTWQAGFSVSYELDLFGRVTRSIEVADAEVGVAQSDVAAARVLIAANVLDAYASACALSASIKAQEDSVAIADRQAELSALLQQAGSVGTLEVERSAALAAITRADLAPIERERRAALLSLAVLLGRSPSNIPESAERCRTNPTISAAIPVGNGASLLRRRPDVARAERLLAAETGRIGIATADLYPTIRFGGSLSQLGGVGPSSGLNFGVGPLLSITIPNQSAGRARVRQAEGRAQTALARFDGTVLAALREVEQAIDGYGAAQHRNTALLDAERRADRAYRLANTLERAGSIGQLDLLVAQRTLTDAKLQNARSDETMTRAQIALFKALGGGWSETHRENLENSDAR